ncbi:hypothetical protein JCM19231_5485 [Vibrio ishigakensis]|uniref:Uncharacterized protein n=1 Tax=Vibrio ishigakensis TaxID=1481914 RepID=A0A0B8P0E8_9VIBR|nr:hypothetical protein JCM19231_5485 [Vibrio ishigakensis]
MAEKLRDWVKDVEEEPEEITTEHEVVEEHEPLEAEEKEQQESVEIAAEQESDEPGESEGETKYPT